MEKSIFQTLSKLKLTSKETRFVFNKGTRDNENLIVWKDKISGIIYIDDYYIGDNTYVNGSYRDNEVDIIGKPDFELYNDAQRRLEANLQYVSGKRIFDFGCGKAQFLRLVQDHCSEIVGVELQKNYVNSLNKDGINCVFSLQELSDNSFDVCVSFHVLEHLPNPLEILSSLKKKIISGGILILEVPHANDFLLSVAQNEPFKQFTLWSQHLVLHTRESLKCMLEYVGFEDILIKSVQRYPLSNHLNWIINGKPGGHKSELSSLETPYLRDAYTNSLSKINATDTLVAIAKVL